jgi:F0F1-type ATP synthase assembly protein I
MDEKDKNSKKKTYMHYSGMAYELVAILIVGVIAGKKLDAWLELDKPYMTLGLLMVFLIAYFVRLYYVLIK